MLPRINHSPCGRPSHRWTQSANLIQNTHELVKTRIKLVIICQNFPSLFRELADNFTDSAICSPLNGNILPMMVENLDRRILQTR